MFNKSRFVVLAVLGLVAFEVSSASAAGWSASGSRGGTIAGPARTFGSSYRGWGGIGYGLGYGYGYPGWGYAPWIAGYGYELAGVPYFSQFPPVYYGYEDSVPVVKAPIRSSWSASVGPQPATGPAPVASPPPPPLRIINPYYVETQADKP
jgi:hypothetical protein